MEFQELCQQVTDGAVNWPTHPVTIFAGTECPQLFLTELLAQLAPLGHVGVDLRGQTIDDIRIQLETTFLGTTRLLWLHGFSELDQRIRKKWIAYFADYKGPHQITFFSSSDDIRTEQPGLCVVPLPVKVTAPLFEAMARVVSLPLSAEIMGQVRRILLQGTVSVDTAYLLIHYITFSGNYLRTFMNHWLSELVIPEASLFALSGVLFSGDRKAFLKQWSQVHNSYSPQFWTSFWSEQLFRAASYVRLMNQGKQPQARAISARLPFSFTRTDWKRHRVQQLQQLHAEIARIDEQLKQGADSCLLDLFYLRCLSHAEK